MYLLRQENKVKKAQAQTPEHFCRSRRGWRRSCWAQPEAPGAWAGDWVGGRAARHGLAAPWAAGTASASAAAPVAPTTAPPSSPSPWPIPLWPKGSPLHQPPCTHRLRWSSLAKPAPAEDHVPGWLPSIQSVPGHGSCAAPAPGWLGEGGFLPSPLLLPFPPTSQPKSLQNTITSACRAMVM